MKNADFKSLIQKAKDRSVLEYLHATGRKPSKINGDSYWFSSPIRPGDEDPSFKVNNRMNRWYDWGSGDKGDLIDLVMKMENVSFTTAISKITNSRLTNSFSLGGNNGLANHSPAARNKTVDPRIKLQKVQDLRNPALIEYVTSRGIPVNTARGYLKEAYYFINSKHYFSVAFRNDKGGYELRNKYYKNCVSPKHYTTCNPGGSSVDIFEGFMDFLSYLVFFNQKRADNTTIVLNSLSFLNDLMDDLGSYKEINLYLDNDDAGREAAWRVMREYPQAKDWSRFIYPHHKDFNQYLEKTVKSVGNNA